MPRMPGMFRPQGAQTREQQRRDYDRRRGSASERGYDHSWSKASKAFLELHPLCCGCDAVGLVAAARLTDHIQPHKGDAALFWDRSNWQACCQWHHDVVKQKLELKWQRGEIGVADLRLDGSVAIALSKALDPRI